MLAMKTIETQEDLIPDINLYYTPPPSHGLVSREQRIREQRISLEMRVLSEISCAEHRVECRSRDRANCPVILVESRSFLPRERETDIYIYIYLFFWAFYKFYRRDESQQYPCNICFFFARKKSQVISSLSRARVPGTRIIINNNENTLFVSS